MRFRFLYLILIMISVASCSKKIQPEKPILGQTQFNIDSMPLSELNIPIAIN